MVASVALNYDTGAVISHIFVDGSKDDLPCKQVIDNDWTKSWFKHKPLLAVFGSENWVFGHTANRLQQ